MTRFKYLFVLTVLGIMFIAIPVMAADIQVIVDGKAVEFSDQRPYIDENDRTQVPLRAPMEAMGATVEWNDSLKQAVIRKDGTMVEFVIGSDQYNVNNETKNMDTTAVITGNRTCIPIRYAAEAFGAEVDWITDKKAVAIYTKKLTAEEKQELEKQIPEPKARPSEVVKYTNFDGRVWEVTLYSDNTLPLDMGDTTVLSIEKVKYYGKDFIKLTQTGTKYITIQQNNIAGTKSGPNGWGSGSVDGNNIQNPDGTYSLYWELNKYGEGFLTANKLILKSAIDEGYIIANPLK